MENFKIKTAEELYGEWKKSADAVSTRLDLLLMIEDIKEQSFIAGHDLAISEIIKYMEQVTD